MTRIPQKEDGPTRSAVNLTRNLCARLYESNKKGRLAHMLTDGVKRIDHVAIVVRDLEATLRFYCDILGLVPSKVIDFPREGVKIAFLPMGGPGGSEIELLEPTNPTTGVARYLEKRGEGLHHICLEVPDIERALAELRAEGAAVLDESPRPTAEGHGIFLHPKGTSGVLLELVQRAEDKEM